MISEPDAQAALALNENRLGWVAPGCLESAKIDPDHLYNDIKIRNAKAAAFEVQFSRTVALESCERVAEVLLKT